MTTTVTILGQGEMGRALAHVLAARIDIHQERWDKNTSIVPDQRSLSVIVPASDIVFVCVPTWSARGVLQTIAPLLAPTTIVVTLCKGFEKETCTNVHDLFTRNLPSATPFVFLGGPMIAEELMNDLPTVALVTSANPHARAIITALFAHTVVATQESDDIVGATLSGALKNVYALGLGMSDGLNLGRNTHGILLTRAVEEMVRIVVALGGKRETALGIAGMGDLVATSSSAQSTNYSTGVRFAQHLPPLCGSEALNTLACIQSVLRDHVASIPFFEAINAVGEAGYDPRAAISTLLH